jgi:hypothetical protein
VSTTRVLVFFLSTIILVGCQSAPTTPDKKASHVENDDEDAEPTSINYLALKKHLGLNRGAQDLGFEEAPFNTCQPGFGLPTSDCRQNYFVVIHYRLQCRDSHGTVSYALTSADIHPIASKDVTWNLKGLQGHSKTDGDGFGQIYAISPQSQKLQRLRLMVGTEFLYIRAGEINRIVAPGTWCEAD